MPTKATKPVDASKPTHSRARKRPVSKLTPANHVDHVAIAERAYFIHLHEGSSDQLANWLRAERELAAA